MRYLLALLLLSGTAHATQHLANLGNAFGGTSSTRTIALCAGPTGPCGASRVFPPSTGAIACVVPDFMPPTGVTAGLACYADPPVDVVVPPPPPPPVALTPVGPGKLADEGMSFIPTVTMMVKYCTSLNVGCETGQTIARAITGTTYLCSKDQFGGVAGKSCFGTAVPDACWPMDPFKYKAIVPIPPMASTEATDALVFIDACTGMARVLPFNTEQSADVLRNLASFIAGGSDSINAYRKAKGVSALTPELNAWMLATAKTYDVPVVPPTYPARWVQPISSGTRPYYASNASGTGIGTKKGNVAVQTDCDGSKRLGTTNYYWVPSVGGYSICSLKP